MSMNIVVKESEEYQSYVQIEMNWTLLCVVISGAYICVRVKQIHLKVDKRFL